MLKKRKTLVAGVIILVAVIAFASQSVFVVRTSQHVIVIRFGRPIGDPISSAGWKFKVPLVDEVRRFDGSIQKWSVDPDEFPTKDGVLIWVDTDVWWQITNPLRFLERLRDENLAQARLDYFLDRRTRDAVARHELLNLFRSGERSPQQDATQSGGEDDLEVIGVGTDEIRQEILAVLREDVADLGIEIHDVQFHRIEAAK